MPMCCLALPFTSHGLQQLPVSFILFDAVIQRVEFPEPIPQESTVFIGSTGQRPHSNVSHVTRCVTKQNCLAGMTKGEGSGELRSDGMSQIKTHR